MKRNYRNMLIGAGMSIAVITAAAAPVTAVESTFLGKGDVQFALGWNNSQLQAAADTLSFRMVTESTSEYSWTCVNEINERVQVRTSVVRVSNESLFDSVARDKRNNVTGFYLSPDPTGSQETIEYQGPKPDTCPQGPWVYEGPLALEANTSPETPSDAETLQVSIDNGETWVGV
jgi:hypothetical protein